MATGGPPVEQLRGYLLQLPSAKRALLIAELERALLNGGEIPGGDLLLQEVRSSVRESGLSLEVLGWSFKFTVDGDKLVLVEANPVPPQVI